MNPRITYYPNGNKKCEYYYNDSGRYHNESGPSIIWFYENGIKCSESYYINGNYHNIKGPVFISYDGNSKIKNKLYYLNGKKIYVNTDEELFKYIKLLNIS